VTKVGIAQQELYPFKDYRVKREKTSKRAIIKGIYPEQNESEVLY
jgi:hypothetical protein